METCDGWELFYVVVDYAGVYSCVGSGSEGCGDFGGGGTKYDGGLWIRFCGLYEEEFGERRNGWGGVEKLRGGEGS